MLATVLERPSPHVYVAPSLSIFTTGRMGAGKDTFADYLVEKHRFAKAAFADGIRGFIRAHNPKYKPKSNRALEIDVGNSMRRWFGDDWWIRETLSYFDNNTFNEHCAGRVISDGRFPLEYEVCVKQHNFIHVHIDAHAPLRRGRLWNRDTAFDATHFYSPDDCQIPITDATYVLYNNGTVEQFYRQIDELISKLKG